MSQQIVYVSFNEVVLVAKKIAKCGFRATIQIYITGTSRPMDRPWIITVGESEWQRHIVVERVIDDDEAMLAVLGPDQSAKFGYDININDVVMRIKLTDLVRDNYVGVKNFLQPQAQMA